MNDQYLKFLREHGVNLEKALGVKEWALSRDDALTAIGILRDGHEAVLGGDVIFEREGRLRYTTTIGIAIRERMNRLPRTSRGVLPKLKDTFGSTRKRTKGSTTMSSCRGYNVSGTLSFNTKILLTPREK
jgi:hypothetical protein